MRCNLDRGVIAACAKAVAIRVMAGLKRDGKHRARSWHWDVSRYKAILMGNRHPSSRLLRHHIEQRLQMQIVKLDVLNIAWIEPVRAIRVFPSLCDCGPVPCARDT